MGVSLSNILFYYGIPVFAAVFVSVLSVIAFGLFVAHAKVAALLLSEEPALIGEDIARKETMQ